MPEEDPTCTLPHGAPWTGAELVGFCDQDGSQALGKKEAKQCVNKAIKEGHLPEAMGDYVKSEINQAYRGAEPGTEYNAEQIDAHLYRETWSPEPPMNGDDLVAICDAAHQFETTGTYDATMATSGTPAASMTEEEAISCVSHVFPEGSDIGSHIEGEIHDIYRDAPEGTAYTGREVNEWIEGQFEDFQQGTSTTPGDSYYNSYYTTDYTRSHDYTGSYTAADIGTAGGSWSNDGTAGDVEGTFAAPGDASATAGSATPPATGTYTTAAGM